MYITHTSDLNKNPTVENKWNENEGKRTVWSNFSFLPRNLFSPVGKEVSGLVYAESSMEFLSMNMSYNS